MKRSKAGRLVRHDDGRTGIAYNDDQTNEMRNDGYLVVRFYEGESLMSALSEEYSKVPVKRLTVTGFID